MLPGGGHRPGFQSCADVKEQIMVPVLINVQ